MAHRLSFHDLCSTALALAASAAAQQPVPVAYPQDSVLGDWHNCAPLGQGVSGSCNEARAQVLIPQAYLPSTGGVITGIEVTVSTPYVSTVSYQILDINVGVTNAPFLNPTFAVNLPNPVPVLSLRPPNATINYVLGGWTLLPFTVPFPYRGTGNLVIEFRKSVTPASVDTYMKVPSEPRRFDLVPHINALGPGSMNATMATQTGNHPLRMRLWFQNGRSLTVQNAPGGVRNHEFARGTAVTMSVHGAPGDIYLSLVDFQGLGFAFAPWSLGGVQGLCYLNLGPWLIAVGQGIVNGVGVGVSSFQIPNDPYFVGKKVAFQSLAGTLATGWSWTPATDAIVNW